MDKVCYSCGMPLMGEAAEKARGNYCQYCSDEKGDLLPKEQVKAGIAGYLKSWAPTDKTADFEKRAESYMNAMPAWAER
ncbi:MAG: hypothetical protein KAU17_12205 [Spirochaetales bacterium]|nr:hypothetical protein [Spirochaetales bacterium]